MARNGCQRMDTFELTTKVAKIEELNIVKRLRSRWKNSSALRLHWDG